MARGRFAAKRNNRQRIYRPTPREQVDRYIARSTEGMRQIIERENAQRLAAERARQTALVLDRMHAVGGGALCTVIGLLGYSLHLSNQGIANQWLVFIAFCWLLAFVYYLLRKYFIHG